MKNLYEGISGMKYEYDLSNPMDRLDYLIDISTRLINDPLNSIDPNVWFDKAMGQNGGGIMGENPRLPLNPFKKDMK